MLPEEPGGDTVELFFNTGVVYHEVALLAPPADKIAGFVYTDGGGFRVAQDWEEPDIEFAVLEILGAFTRRWLPIPYQLSCPLCVQVFLSEDLVSPPAGGPARLLLAVDTAEQTDSGGIHLDGRLDAYRPFRALTQGELDDFFQLTDIKDFLGRLEQAGLERAGVKLSAVLGTLAPLLPRLQFLPRESEAARDVSLVLDLGNSRSSALLVETGERGVSAVPLAFRNFSNPFEVSEETFDSRFTFLANPFDQRANIVATGRCFATPSVVRMGREALDRAVETPARYACSLSGPKRYLWDSQVHSEPWHFAGRLQEGYCKVFGNLLKRIPEHGDGLQLREDGPATPADPRYAPRAMMLFALVEIFSQAVSQINSPKYRNYQGKESSPRVLRHVVLTYPSAMHAEERRVYEQLAQNAAHLVSEYYRIPADQRPNWNSQGFYDDFLFMDEALAAQMVFVYQNAEETFAGSMEDFLDVFGRGKQSLRVASVDIGGGTTDVMIAEYKDRMKGSGTSLVIRKLFQDGVNIAGDEVCRALVEEVIFRQILMQIESQAARRKLVHLFGSGETGHGAFWRSLRAKLVPYFWLPLARCYWAIAEGREIPDHNPQKLYFLDSIFQVFEDVSWSSTVLGAADEFLSQAIGDFPGLHNLAFRFDGEDVDRVVTGVLYEPLRKYADIISQFDVDLLVLAGRTSSLRAVRRIFVREMPVPAARIKSLAAYRVGDWYPAKWRAGNLIKDPKSTVAAGATVLHLATRNRIPGFMLDEIRELETRPIYGILQAAEPYVARADELFAQERISKDIPYTGGLRIGARNVASPEMEAAPLYEVRPAGRDVQEALLEDRVSLKFELAADPPGTIRIHSVVSHRDIFEFNTGNFVLALKTLDEQKYWTDTGIFKNIEQHL